MFRALILSAVVLFAGSAQAVNYFSWGAETASTVTMNGASAPIYEYKSNTTRDCTVAHSGSCSMKMVIIGNDSGNQSSGIDIDQNPYGFNMVGSGDIYYRWWMRINTGFNWGSGSNPKVKSSRTGAGAQGYTGYLYRNGINLAECDSFSDSACRDVNGSSCGSDSCMMISHTFVADSQWHEYIVRVRPNSAGCTPGVNCDGQLQFWVDGVSKGSLSGFRLHTNASNAMSEFWGGWMTFPYWQLNGLAGEGGTLYIDDISTDSVWNSIFGGSDTTPPTISGGLPTGTLNYGATSTVMQVTTSENATCKYGSSDAAYASLPSTFSSTGGVTHTQTLTGLTNGSSYTRYVRCIDAAGNATTSSTVISFSVSSTASSSECPSNWATLHPTWIWCDDFETNKLSNYFDADGLMTRTAAIGYGASYAMRASWASAQVDAGSLKVAFGLVPAGGGFTQPTGVSTTTKYTEVYYRVYLRSQSGWVAGSGKQSKFARVTAFSANNWSQAMISHLWSNDTGGNNDYLRQDPVSCVSGGTVLCSGYNDFANFTWLTATNGPLAVFASPNTGNWQCIEAHVKLNASGSSNGVAEFWVDGVQQASTTNLNFVGTYTAYGINALFIENYINGGSPQAQVRDFDNLVIATTRIGCNPAGVSLLPGPGNVRWRPIKWWRINDGGNFHMTSYKVH